MPHFPIRSRSYTARLPSSPKQYHPPRIGEEAQKMPAGFRDSAQARSGKVVRQEHPIIDRPVVIRPRPEYLVDDNPSRWEGVSIWHEIESSMARVYLNVTIPQIRRDIPVEYPLGGRLSDERVVPAITVGEKPWVTGVPEEPLHLLTSVADSNNIHAQAHSYEGSKRGQKGVEPQRQGQRYADADPCEQGKRGTCLAS